MLALKLAKKTVIGAGMAHRSRRIAAQDQSVLIAIDQDFADRQHVSRSLTLLPKLAARSGVKMCKTGLARGCQRLIVHEREHEHVSAVMIYDDRSEQALGIEFGTESFTHAGCLMPVVAG